MLTCLSQVSERQSSIVVAAPMLVLPCTMELLTTVAADTVNKLVISAHHRAETL